MVPERKVTERYGHQKDLDRSFDIAFWQAQTSEARFAAAWELVVAAMARKGIPESELRLQRTVERFFMPQQLTSRAVICREPGC